MNASALGFAAVLIFVVLLVLFIAGVTTTVESTPGATPLAAPPGTGNLVVAAPVVMPTNTPVAVTAGTTYTIQAGDWLSDIARRYNTTVPAILTANPQITDSDAIQPGETIVLPSTTE